MPMTLPEITVSPARLPAVIADLYAQPELFFKLAVANEISATSWTIRYIFARAGEHAHQVLRLTITEPRFPSVADLVPPVSIYERRIKEMFGLFPVGHPHPQPVVLHDAGMLAGHPLAKATPYDAALASGTPIPYEFQHVAGEGIYEVPVGPVHAGIIEPGHFRFSMAGEEIVILDPRLGYVHKGSEKLFETLPLARTVALAEHIAGDTAFTHSLAYCQALEDLLGLAVPERATYLRVLFSELERLANHLNDIGFIMLDTGYNFGGASGTRLREQVMQFNEELTGHRFLRNVNTIGGLARDLSTSQLRQLQQALAGLEKDFNEVIAIAQKSGILFNRLEGTGIVRPEHIRAAGAVGVPARASGVARDARRNHPYAAYPALAFEIATETGGDVLARFNVRIQEVHQSLRLIDQVIQTLPAGPIVARADRAALPAHREALGLAEGWRGEIIYYVVTNARGALDRVAVRDPSVPNWQLLPIAGQDNVLLDFPLINKSFNLSYTGHDL